MDYSKHQNEKTTEIPRVQAAKNETMTAIRAMLAIVAVVLVTELIISSILIALGYAYHTPGTLFVDAIVLGLVVAPPIYWLVLRPVRREYEKRLVAEERAEDMGRLAITDPLTRIMNRRGITVALLDAMAQSERYRTPLTIAMADIDHFKNVNDTYGHEAGDKVLAELAGVLADGLRMPDKAGRYGGEEFLLIFPHTNLVQGRKISDRIRVAVGKHRIELDEGKVQLTISIGVVQFQRGEDLEQLLSRSDRALYAAKEAGRNRVVAAKTAR
jgi:diguanylate cyclase (GGDEF)-like protein